MPAAKLLEYLGKPKAPLSTTCRIDKSRKAKKRSPSLPNSNHQPNRKTSLEALA
jgi:hypothetical protein